MSVDGDTFRFTWRRRTGNPTFWAAATVAIGVALPGCDYGEPVIGMPAPIAIDVDAVGDPALFLAALVDEGAILRADGNADGVVDITDLVIGAQSLGDVCTNAAAHVTRLG